MLQHQGAVGVEHAEEGRGGQGEPWGGISAGILRGERVIGGGDRGIGHSLGEGVP